MGYKYGLQTCVLANLARNTQNPHIDYGKIMQHSLDRALTFGESRAGLVIRVSLTDFSGGSHEKQKLSSFS